MEENESKEGDATVVYEVSFLLLPSLAIEQVPGIAATLKTTLTGLGGEIISGEDPVLIDLAYPMTKIVGTTRHKVTTGYFGWLKFAMSKETNSEGMEKVKKVLDVSESIVRYLIIKTVRENTLLNGKMKLQKEEKVRRVEDEEIPADVPEAEVEKEVVAEDIDKSIDELVIA